jgi:ABC-type lipoprotein export system ATPase subunit
MAHDHLESPTHRYNAWDHHTSHESTSSGRYVQRTVIFRGEQQRIVLARTPVLELRGLLLDEPPCTLFVADFIDTMNLLAGRYAAADRTIRVADARLSVGDFGWKDGEELQ